MIIRKGDRLVLAMSGDWVTHDRAERLKASIREAIPELAGVTILTGVSGMAVTRDEDDECRCGGQEAHSRGPCCRPPFAWPDRADLTARCPACGAGPFAAPVRLREHIDEAHNGHYGVALESGCMNCGPHPHSTGWCAMCDSCPDDRPAQNPDYGVDPDTTGALADMCSQLPGCSDGRHSESCEAGMELRTRALARETRYGVSGHPIDPVVCRNGLGTRCGPADCVLDHARTPFEVEDRRIGVWKGGVALALRNVLAEVDAHEVATARGGMPYAETVEMLRRVATEMGVNL
jgi:hypothetical protein